MPRHPPCALSSLTVKLTCEQRCSRENLSVHLHSKTCLVFLCRYSIVKDQNYFRRSVETSTLNWPARDVIFPHLVADLRTQVPMCVHILKSEISKFKIADPGGGEGIRTPDPRVANAVLCQLSYTPENISNSEIRISSRGWLRGRDLNPRPLGYEPNELPDCSTPRQNQPSLMLSTQSSQSNLQRQDYPNPKTRSLSGISNLRSEISMVGLGRVELPTSRLSGVRSNQLSYRPISFLRHS